MKTLALILHCNTPDLTNSLYESLAPAANELYDLYVLDNGSDENKKSRYPSLFTNENLYFGGGLNWAFDYIIKNKQYDSLLFLNSDLILNGESFVKTLREEMFTNNFKILSPSILSEHGKPGANWKQMENYKSDKTRQVKWIDFQCPLFSRKFITNVKKFSDDLRFGWGQEVLSGIICLEQNWKIGVTDKVGVDHIGWATERANKCHLRVHRQQKINMRTYFKNINKLEMMHDLRSWADAYKYE